MKKPIKIIRYYCKHCGTECGMPEKEVGPISVRPGPPYCPVCETKNKKRKMLEIEKECTK